MNCMNTQQNLRNCKTFLIIFQYHTVPQVGNSLVAAGGRTSNRKLDSVEILTNGGSWQLASWKLSELLKSHCAVAGADDTEMIVIGGVAGNGVKSAKVTKYRD